MGTFRVYEDQKLVLEAENILTVYGREQIPRILCGKARGVIALSVGGGTTAANVNDKWLAAPITVKPIVFSTPITYGTAGKVVYKARLDEAFGGVIYEMASTNDGAAAPGQIVQILQSDFVTITGGGSFVAGPGAELGSALTNIRCSPSGASLPASGRLTSTFPVALGSALQSDNVLLTGYLGAATATTATLTFTDTSGLTASGTYSFANNTSYQMIQKPISGFTVGGGFDWGSIVKTDVVKDGTATVLIVDGVAVQSEVLGGRIMSRAVVGTPITKRVGSKMDVEYELNLTLS